LTARHRRGWKAALRVRGVGDRPIVDPGDQAAFVAAGRPVPQAQRYTVVDAFAGYEAGWFELGIALENLLDTDWREAQLANRSCSRAENGNPASACFIGPGGLRSRGGDILPDVHFTPGNPFNVMTSAKVFF
jgi:outer membrane receptor protein involved in Fe transport